MLKSRKQKTFEVIKSVLESNKKVGKYYQTLTYLNTKQIYKILENALKAKLKVILF